MKHLIVIGGATATGKTALAIKVAQHLGTEILSADSRQFYREMNIGTAKPSPAELAAVRHHFVDTLDVTDDFSVGDFEREALRVLGKIYSEKDVAVLVGGSGLYLRAVCEGLDAFPDVSAETKKQVEAGIRTGGLAWLQAELAQRDPTYFEKVDKQNPARLRRALEVCWETRAPYSAFLGHEKKPRAFNPIYLLLELPRPLLYARIEARVDAMVAAGLEAEARGLFHLRARPALHTVGYEEWFDFFDGKISREEAVGKIKQHTRNYAKRQATWFRKHGAWEIFQPDDWEGVLRFLKVRL
ncbi:MAG: tRNA (adenosine(37)-N6)-dimethylallyltransferase MiaA [Saprospiraceae bacterium]|nr:tRNA (adenosine(37)-N6)-dimethylallyltransferase MiaA [Saprospiraceae bacterium]